jgi:virginiamycin B lyase
LEGRTLLSSSYHEFPIAGYIPFDLSLGPDGSLWITEVSGNTRKIGWITPTGVINQVANSDGDYLIDVGTDGNLWFQTLLTQAGMQVPTIGRMTAEGSVMIEFPAPLSTDYTLGPDGNLWFTSVSAGQVPYQNYVGRITPSGAVSENAVSAPPSARLTAITTGRDGNLWFTGTGLGSIGRITPAGIVSEFPLPDPATQSSAIAPGPDGNVWFAEDSFGLKKIGRITPSGVISEFPLPLPQRLMSQFITHITAGPDGNVWAAFSGGGIVDRITPAGAISQFAIPQAGTSTGLATGSDGNLWLTKGFVDSHGAAQGEVVQFDVRSSTPLTQNGGHPRRGSHHPAPRRHPRNHRSHSKLPPAEPR